MTAVRRHRAPAAALLALLTIALIAFAAPAAAASLEVTTTAEQGPGSLGETILEAGADDMKRQGDNFEVFCTPDQFMAVGEALDKAQIPTNVREVSRIPSNTVDLDATSARSVLKLMEALDDHDDVQNVFANFNLPDEVAAELAAD